MTKQSFLVCLKQLLSALILGFGICWLQEVAADDTVMEMIELRNRPAAEIQPLLMPLLEASEVVSGTGFSLIVKASPARLEDIRRLIEHLDTRLRNLTISVLQSSHKTAEQLNAEASIALSPDAIRMHGMTGDTRDVDSQRMMQQLRTMEGQAAHIEVGELRPYEYITIYDLGYGYPGVASNTQLQEASSGFAVIPRLQAENIVMVDIEPWSDRFRGSGRIETQTIHTSLRVRLGEWIEIGSIGSQEQADHRGANGLNYTTTEHAVRILIKVDLAD